MTSICVRPFNATTRSSPLWLAGSSALLSPGANEAEMSTIRTMEIRHEQLADDLRARNALVAALVAPHQRVVRVVIHEQAEQRDAERCRDRAEDRGRPVGRSPFDLADLALGDPDATAQFGGARAALLADVRADAPVGTALDHLVLRGGLVAGKSFSGS